MASTQHPMKHLIFCLPFLFFGTTVSAQTAAEIIEKHLVARGGSALDSVRNTKMDIEVVLKNAPGMTFKATYSTVMMQSHRIDMSVPNLYDAVICFSGDQGWGVLKKDGKSDLTLMDSAAVQELKYQTEILGPLYQYQQKGYKVEYLGREQVNETETFNIKVEAANNTTYNCFIDTQTFMEVKRAVIAPSNGQMISVEFYYSDLKPVLGVIMPFKIEMSNRKGTTYFIFQTIELNTNLDPKLFEVPSGQ